MDKKSELMNISVSIFLVFMGVLSVVLATLKVMRYSLAMLMLGVSLLVPFLLLFERSRARAKVLVLIATLSALAIVGRVIFGFVPNVTLSTGIVILAGACLGAVPGFVVGALTMLVSNMLLGQGLWTVWQMLLVGVIGMLAGAFRHADKVTLALYAVFVAFLYGFIMDIFTLVTVYDVITLERFLVVWGASFYFDLAHAISTVATVLLFYNVIVRPIRRQMTR